jgi:hypothetical protein
VFTVLAATALAGAQVASAAASATGSAASPAAVATWHQVESYNVNNVAEIGLARGKDGILHVLWLKGISPYSIIDTTVTAAGVGKSAVVASGEFLANDPDATVTPAGISVFWNASPSSTNGLLDGIYTARRPLKGGAWSKPARAAKTVSAGAVEDVIDTAATDKSGRPWVAYTLTDTLAITPIGKPSQVIPPTACCVYTPGLASDGSSGLTWVTYYSNITNHTGIYAQRLTAIGKASGAAIRLPNSATAGSAISPEQRVATVSRGPGRPGVYAAYGAGYPSITKVLVDKLGAAKAMTVAASSSISAITAAVDPSGRIWVAWLTNPGGTYHLFISRSNAAVTAFSKPVAVPLPSGTGTAWKVYLNATNTSADVMVLVSKGINSSVATYWTRRVPPPA